MASEAGEVVRATTLVDANVLIDVASGDPTWAGWSEDALAAAGDDGWLVINPIIYAEVSVSYAVIDELDDALPTNVFQREPLPYQAGFVAGKAFVEYRRRGGSRLSPLHDFYIGAHAAVQGYRLLTRDGSRYRRYFPTVDLITP